MSRNGILKTPGRKTTPSSKLKDPIEVFCRVRPLSPSSEESCVEICSDKIVQLNAPKHSKTISNRIEQVRCTFSKVFNEDTSQCDIFDHTGLPLVEDVLNGKNGLCFMYGITGSGKTHTMNGSPSDSGVLPRCLDVIFNSIGSLQTNRCVFRPDGYNGFDVLSDEEAYREAQKKAREIEALNKQGKYNELNDVIRVPDSSTLQVDEDNNYAVFISFVEIYNNAIFDLLDDTPIDPLKQKQPTSKILREDQTRNMFVYETTEVEAKSTEEAFELFWKGQTRRKTAHTLLNTESSRSHCVFTIKLVQAPLGPNGDSILRDRDLIGVSQLSLCDLAGSERLSRTKADGDRVRQAGHINNSLMTLRSCIECLRENQKAQESGGGLKMVPYRDSKLTHLFKNYFDGDGKVRMVVCLNPSAGDFDESLHVMRFSEMTQEVKIARSEGVKFDLGLTPGRGKANKMYQGSLRDDVTSSEVGSQEDLVMPLQLFASWPLLELAGCNDATTLINLMAYLEDRMRLRKTLFSDWKHKHLEVRKSIFQLEQDNIDLTKSMEEQRALLVEKERESKTFEKRIRAINEKNDNLQRTVQLLDMQKRQTDADLEKQREAVHKERQEKLRLKQTLKDLTSSERLRWEKECDKRVRQTQIEMEGAVLAKSEKLRQLRHVVQGLDIPEENQGKIERLIYDEKPDVVSSHHPPASAPAKSKRPAVAKKPLHTRTKTVTGGTPYGRQKVRSKSPPATPSSRNSHAPPIRAKHRRSRSSDYWLEHKPADTLSTNTVMQPHLKNKKTVRTPLVKDFKATPNYILTHQEEDSCGEIETKLIKGEVMKTRGGGTSVQFTDIETLKKSLGAKGGIKMTPKSSGKTPGKKRKSEGEEEPDSEDSWTSIETRCAVGIEGKPGAEPGLMHHAKKHKQ